MSRAVGVCPMEPEDERHDPNGGDKPEALPRRNVTVSASTMADSLQYHYEGGIWAVHISDRMTRNPATIEPKDTLAKAKALMDSGGFRRLPVVEKGQLVGILSDRDLRQHVGYLETTRVNAAMTASPMTVTPHSSVGDAARLMLEHKVGGLPVVEESKLVGIVTTSDMLRALLDLIQATQGTRND